jgi:hypothetical protein
MSIYRLEEMALRRYAKNRPGCENAECGGFKPPRQVQRFLSVHAVVHNLFDLGRHLVRAEHCRSLRISAFRELETVVA